MQKDDLLIEMSNKLINSSDVSEFKEVYPGIKVSEVVLTKDNDSINKQKGKYITITYNNDSDIDDLINEVIDSIKNLLSYLGLNKNKRILFCGLGNKDLSVDKLGYLTIEKIIVSNNTFKIYKNTEGITNISSLEFIKSLVKELKIDLVIIVDSLKANNIERLGKTIQLSTGGININNTSITKRKIKTDIITLGVPLTINMQNVNEDNPNILITTNNVDELVENASSIISIAINRFL